GAAQFTANDGSDYPADQAYNMVFTGSPDWPAQAFNGAAGHFGYMPSNWAPVDPAPQGSADPAFQIPDADFTMTFQPDASTNLPPGYEVNTAIAFKGTGFPGGGPIVLCQFDGTPTTITIPKAMAEILRAYTPGTMSRQHVNHHLEEL